VKEDATNLVNDLASAVATQKFAVHTTADLSNEEMEA